ncbi:hypothetical protein LCGC14_1681170 [marine sediment metagenome]|uniref:NYN domain-containing protein n=1 Tax=marine sediment metagenome TaxID=412755 RepID=A0A0F9IAZ9_9ZZZZ
MQQRVICFVDGFNLYHAIDKLNEPYLKWVNLKCLASVFIRPKSQRLIDVYYFSAYANWLPESKKRHLQYVKALTSAGVKLVMGRFKSKNKKCPKCKTTWNGHEEKETDVNIALALLNLAYKNEYDHACLISNDSDLAPAIHMVRENFPNKEFTTIVPPHYFHSNELIKASTGKAKIKIYHLKECLFSKNIVDVGGNIVATCPKEYIPPKI